MLQETTFHILIMLLLSYNGNRVDGIVDLRSTQRLKHCLKHSQTGPRDGELKTTKSIDYNR